MYVAAPSRERARLQPDLAAISRLAPTCVSCFAGEGRRWKTRMFAPAAGVPEDPATGSAAGPLAVPSGAARRGPWGDEIEIEQGTEIARPSLDARATGSADKIERVEVGARPSSSRGGVQVP